jgi:hypothetical protein
MYHGSRVIIVVGQVRGVKIYVAAVEALTEKERGDDTQFEELNINQRYNILNIVCVCFRP